MFRTSGVLFELMHDANRGIGYYAFFADYPIPQCSSIMPDYTLRNPDYSQPFFYATCQWAED